LPGVVIKGDISTEIKLFIPVGKYITIAKKFQEKEGAMFD
jgi:hypothetical protein